MSYENILYAVEGPIARVTINRPDKMNALNDATLGELKDAFTKAGEDDAVRALLITGAGEKAFVAGADINELLAEAGSAEGAIRVSTTGQDVFRLLEQLGHDIFGDDWGESQSGSANKQGGSPIEVSKHTTYRTGGLASSPTTRGPVNLKICRLSEKAGSAGTSAGAVRRARAGGLRGGSEERPHR